MAENTQVKTDAAVPEASAAPAVSAAPEASTPVRNKYAGADKKKKKRMSGKAKAIIAVIIVALFVGGCWFLIDRLMRSPEDNLEPITGTVMQGRLESFITGYGYSSPKSKADVGEKAVGTVVSVSVIPGDTVKTGDELLVIDPEEAKKDLEDALSELDAAQQTLRDAQQSKANLTVYAPFAGRLVEAVELKAGEPVGEGTELGRLVDDSQMKLSLYFSYGYIEEVSRGMSATVSVPKSMSSLTGTVDSVEPIRKIGDDGTVCFRVSILMDNPGALTEGMEATALIHGTTDIAPYDMGALEYVREEKIYAKSSGDVIGSGIHQYYEYTAGQTMLTLENAGLDASLSAARRSCETAQEKVDNLQKSISESVLTSPIDGQVMAVVVSPGDVVSGAGTPLITIADTSTMTIEASIDEMDISKISVGMPVELSFEQTEGTQYVTGHVSTVSFEAQSNNGGGGGGMGGNVAYFPITISVDNPGGLLPGMGVQFNISAVLLEDCLMVPSSAVIYTDQGPAVYVRAETADQYETIIETPEDTAPAGFVAVPVEIGISDEYNTEVRSGLAADTEVYLFQTTQPNYGIAF